MKQRDELRGGKRVTVIEREPHELPPEQRIAALEADVAQLKQQMQQLLKPPAR